jgi:hypothetical protein
MIGTNIKFVNIENINNINDLPDHGIFLSGCESFLDTENLKKPRRTFGTETEANEMLTSIYANLLFEDPKLRPTSIMHNWQAMIVWAESFRFK